MKKICGQFRLDGLPVSCSRFGNGHINETYLLVTNRAHLYILQKLNGSVFPDLQGVMRNIIAVTAHLRKKEPDPNRVLRLVPTAAGEPYLVTESGEYWRVYEFITGGVCLEQALSPEDFRQSAIAFGRFQNQLADFPADTLVETIPRFHDTPNRYRQLREAVERDPLGRAQSAAREIRGYLSREREASALMEMLNRGELPLRVTQNDTKLNNVMLRDTDHTPLCVMDLDTVMPGLAAMDFGDAIRFGASTAEEDEQDLGKVSLSLELYRAFADGFLAACGERLTPREIETLPLGAKTLTLECGSRFLTDYLNGDVYFHTDYPEHNLIRCRTQLKLAEDMEKKWNEMRSAIRG